ncbi:LuxR C-terminal-related transcriptional regulator [Bradyrhizobium sp. WSM3983]|uniref:LuxR C-terminal-related transcriptional regulator n=1 Tax=Bradyrhizobium sp. WSM3983 TaxID=1038867 RepID=UPI0004276DFC|nr:LuxR C-terminal-related transcriptional regulator [Bradyrhizobium sp. WSM3983]
MVPKFPISDSFRPGLPGKAKEAITHIERVLSVAERSTVADKNPGIATSWRRSNANRVDPGSGEPPRVLTGSELSTMREPLNELISEASDELDRLVKIVRPAHYTVLLCDSRGIAIDHRGDEADAALFKHWGIWLGGVWSEDIEGTNGIGTCIVEQQPITVHRKQHFRARHIGLSCSAAPIFGEDGELVGVLDVSSFDRVLSEQSHALTGELVRTSACAIEERWFRSRHHRDWVVGFTPPGGSAPPMLIALDDDQRIIGADRNAQRLLRHDDTPQNGVSLWSVFRPARSLFFRAAGGNFAASLIPLSGIEPWPVVITPPAAPRSAYRPRPRGLVPGDDLEKRRHGPADLQQLTPRERVVLRELLEGNSSKRVARKLGISPRTVEFHRANIIRKLGARNTAELIAIVLGVHERDAHDARPE